VLKAGGALPGIAAVGGAGAVLIVQLQLHRQLRHQGVLVARCILGLQLQLHGGAGVVGGQEAAIDSAALILAELGGVLRLDDLHRVQRGGRGGHRVPLGDAGGIRGIGGESLGSRSARRLGGGELQGGHLVCAHILPDIAASAGLRRIHRPPAVLAPLQRDVVGTVGSAADRVAVGIRVPVGRVADMQGGPGELIGGDQAICIVAQGYGDAQPGDLVLGHEGLSLTAQGGFARGHLHLHRADDLGAERGEVEGLVRRQAGFGLVALGLGGSSQPDDGVCRIPQHHLVRAVIAVGELQAHQLPDAVHPLLAVFSRVSGEFQSPCAIVVNRIGEVLTLAESVVLPRDAVVHHGLQVHRPGVLDADGCDIGRLLQQGVLHARHIQAVGAVLVILGGVRRDDGEDRGLLR